MGAAQPINVLILTNYSGRLNSKALPPPDDTMSTKEISRQLTCLGYQVEVTSYEKLDFSKSYKGWYVFYHSSEEISHNYKSYIQDLILWLYLSGAMLMPEYKYLVAHENKNMMELLRLTFDDPIYKTICSLPFSIPESVSCRKEISFPAVIKAHSGAMSTGVFKAEDRQQLIKIAKKVSLNSFFADKRQTKLVVKNYLGKYWAKYRLNYEDRIRTNKFVVQNFIMGLDGDYKILVYWDKYYVLRRRNRPGDFRASGSGLFEFPDDSDDISSLLDYARGAHIEIGSPMTSLDVAYDGHQYHLLEFQCVSFGTYTLTGATGYYHQVNGIWDKKMQQPLLEDDVVYAIHNYVLQRMEEE